MPGPQAASSSCWRLSTRPRFLTNAVEQLELGQRDVERLAAAPHLAAGEVHLDVAEPKHRRAARGVPPSGSPQQRLDARAQLLRAERLRDVVVGAHLEREHLLRFLRARGEHQDRRPETRLADVAADVEAVPAGQHDVEHDQIERLARSRAATPPAPSPTTSTS